MPMFELRKTWTFTSTGAGTAVELKTGSPTEWTWYLETPGSSLSTATVRIETAWDSTSVFNWIGSSAISLSSAAMQTQGFTGPYTCVRPYAITLGSTATVVKIGVVGV